MVNVAPSVKKHFPISLIEVQTGVAGGDGMVAAGLIMAPKL